MQDKDIVLERMMNEYGDGMVRMAYLYLSDAALAQDAVQDTFIRIYSGMDGFEQRSSEKTWMKSPRRQRPRRNTTTPWRK